MKKNLNIKFTGKATYQIKVQGQLNKSWINSLGGMSIDVEKEKEDQDTTTLTGVITDQAALAGIMNTLYEMHLSVLSVECLSVDNGTNTTLK